MRWHILALLLLIAGTVSAQYRSEVWCPDRGDGTYTNPVLNADYSDPDVICVGNDYYLTASSFQCMPGLPVLHSKDLVNWTIINLSTMTDGNVIYFDDVKLEIREQEKPHEFSEWLNIVRNGVKSKDEMTFGNGTFTTFTGRDGVPGIDQPARIVTDPLGVEPVLSVSSVAATYMRENKDEEGNVTGTTPMYVVREGNLNSGVNVGDSVELTNWQSQFFVAHKHVFHTGQKVKFAIDARADHPTDIETQIHRGPGDYPRGLQKGRPAI